MILSARKKGPAFGSCWPVRPTEPAPCWPSGSSWRGRCSWVAGCSDRAGRGEGPLLTVVHAAPPARSLVWRWGAEPRGVSKHPVNSLRLGASLRTPTPWSRPWSRPVVSSAGRKGGPPAGTERVQGCGCRSRVMDGSGVRRGRAAQRPRLPPAAALSWGGLCRVTTRSLAGRPGEPALCPGPRGVGGGQQRGPWHRHVHGPPGCSAVQDGRGRRAEAEPAPRPLSWRRQTLGTHGWARHRNRARRGGAWGLQWEPQPPRPEAGTVAPAGRASPQVTQTAVLDTDGILREKQLTERPSWQPCFCD